MIDQTQRLNKVEFVSLLAMMISILALSIDIMLPAFGEISRDLMLDDRNQAQLVITSMFLGFAIGQLAMGPLSDWYGRKPVIYGGYVIFIIGCIITIVTEDFAAMLFGRLLQGIGASAPRIVGVALVRDTYKGREMASIMSFVMAIFILVPTVAPAIGQGILWYGNWRLIFVFLLIVAGLAFVWFAFRQPESLAQDQKREFTISRIIQGTKEVFSHRVVAAYTLAAGVIFGGFVGYLSSAQQVFQETYDTRDWFALYFAASSLAIGVSSIINSKLVGRLGMRYICNASLVSITISSILFWGIAMTYSGVPPFWTFMVWILWIMLCNGFLFGNLNALAMEPLGHMAGLAAAVFGAVSTFIAVPIGWAIGAWYQGTVEPLVVGHIVVGILSMLTIRFLIKSTAKN